MGEETLVESKITEAIQLIQQLDIIGDSPSLVAWYFYDDIAQWKLLIAGPSFDVLLPKQEAIAYRKIIEVLAGLSLSSVAISDLKLVSTNSPLPRVLGFLIKTPRTGVSHAHFANTTVSGIFIKEMFILRSA